ncbi:YqiA/YcfP family alpha/beta fold hydrolase [Salinimicrobium terrae]|uniref:YqiA/YcfP family alpha/beta fold hydrolase n=1 Tax=Salinimicrobium terrae TaxID=470866 RepID=UPI0003F6819C|nr:YqiA/YcfP family alpha/beta fold hydrolase [Salinimicrobium terrae]
MNILYLHGLDSKLSPEKKAILEKYGKVHAPEVNYYTNPDAIKTYLNSCTGLDINVVMGSSMGGFAAYYVSNALVRPALLFNPALKKRSVPQNIPSEISYNNLKHIVIGQRDGVVAPADTLSFLSENFNPVTNIHVHLAPGLDHNIPVEFFEKEVKAFLERL